jgi:hypothetical protein
VRENKKFASRAAVTLAIAALVGTSALAEPSRSKETAGVSSERRSSSRNTRSGRPYYHEGRVTKIQRQGEGYRVWVGGARYPFDVRQAYWDAGRFAVGSRVALGGYYNSRGYYDYAPRYLDEYMEHYTRDRRLHSQPDFFGEVEEVRGDELLVRDAGTGESIRVVLRDRRETRPRVGNYIGVRGDWTTMGYFRAYDVDIVD